MKKRGTFKEILDNQYTKPLLFFGFYFFFFLFLFSFINIDKIDINEENKNSWKNINNNYKYKYEITNNDNIVILEGKKYNNKELFIKEINGIKEAEYYRFYNDFYIKEDKYKKLEVFYYVDESFDHNLIDINYIKTITIESNLINKETNIDKTISEIYEIDNIKIEIITENDILQMVKINKDNYIILLQYIDIDKIEDFVVEK